MAGETGGVILNDVQRGCRLLNAGDLEAPAAACAPDQPCLVRSGSHCQCHTAPLNADALHWLGGETFPGAEEQI